MAPLRCSFFGNDGRFRLYHKQTIIPNDKFQIVSLVGCGAKSYEWFLKQQLKKSGCPCAAARVIRFLPA